MSYIRVNETREETEQYRAKHGHLPRVHRLACVDCGHRLWGSGLGVGSHNRKHERENARQHAENLAKLGEVLHGGPPNAAPGATVGKPADPFAGIPDAHPQEVYEFTPEELVRGVVARTVAAYEPAVPPRHVSVQLRSTTEGAAVYALLALMRGDVPLAKRHLSDLYPSDAAAVASEAGTLAGLARDQRAIAERWAQERRDRFDPNTTRVGTDQP